MWIKKILLIFALSFMSYSAISVDSINFPIPANLKNNVQFWTMIYTDVSLKEGLLHDRDNPLLIYKKIHVGALWGKPLDKFVNQHRIRIARSISIIKRQHRSTWGPEEQRIAALLDKFPAAVLDSAEDRIRFQLGQRERFKDGLERSTVYLDTIRSIMCNHGLPEYLAFLPHVESSYNYKAYSRVGAAGLWQFMPTTGKDYLRIDYSIDERRDPILSTIAAAKLLKKNYKKLKAWPLAITAYNYGLNGMLRAVNTIGTRDIGIIIDKHDSPIFRFASRNFYSCFLAASMIAANPDKYFDNIRVSPPQRFTDLVLESHMSPSDICKFLNIGEKEFASLNPSIRDIVYKYKKPIPRGYTIRIGGEKSIDELRTIASRHSPKKQPEIKGEDYYIVKKGDNLSSIAKALRVSTDRITEYNGINKKKPLYIGQVLRIPEKTATQLASKEKILIPELKTVTTKKSTAVTPPTTKPQKPASAPDTLAKANDSKAIADSNTIVKELPKSQADNFDANVYVLDLIRIDSQSVEIRVSYGETIAHYANWLKTDAHSLYSLNKLNATAQLSLEQRILLPIDTKAVSRFNRQRLEFHMANEEDFFNQYTISSVKKHMVEANETMQSLCSGAIPLWLFKKLNKTLDTSDLKPGTVVQLPTIMAKTPTSEPTYFDQ